MSTALSIAMSELKTEQPTISGIKKYAISRFETEFPDFQINGQEDGFYTILNILLPLSEEKNSLLLFHLDMKGIAISRGSACQSGSSRPSHVLAELLSPSDLKKPSLRISLSHDSTKEDIDALIAALKQLD
jgi:cysteine desulfurase